MGSDSAEEETACSRYIKMGIAVLSVIMAVISYSAAAKAYDTLNEVSTDYNYLLDHWQRKPIKDIRLVGASESCPSGYVEGDLSRDGNDAQRVGGWLGTTDYCDARTEGYAYQVTEYRCQCSSNDDSSYETGWRTSRPTCSKSGCYIETRTYTNTFYTAAGACNSTQIAAGMATDPSLPEVTLDVWRSKKLCYQRGGWAAMNRATVADGCPGGVVCGNGTYQDDNTICAPSVDDCPITAMSDLKEAAVSNSQLTFETGANGGAVSGLPINQVWMVMNVPCWHGLQGYKNRASVSPRVRQPFDGGCDDIDTRFEPWDGIPEDYLYEQNDVPTSGGQTIGGKNNYPTEQVQIFNYSTYQYQWGYFYMREQYWDPDCDLGLMDRVEGYEDDIETVQSYQKTLLTLNGIFTLGFSLIYCIFVFVHNCDDNLDSDWIPGHGADEQKNIDNCQSVVTVIAIIARFIPLILCLVMTKAMESWMNKAQVSDCSQPKDGITDQIVRNAGAEMQSVYDTNVQVLIFDILNFLLIFAPIIYNKCCKSGKSKGSDDEGNDDEETGGEKIEEQVEMEPQQNPYMPYMQQNAPVYGKRDVADANNDGIPDIYQSNLPPGFECRMDAQSGKPYWIDHNNQASTWIDPRTTAQYAPQQQVVPQYGMAAASEVPEQYTYGLAPNWEAKIDPATSRPYWVDHNTQQSTWIDPRQTANPYVQTANPYLQG